MVLVCAVDNFFLKTGLFTAYQSKLIACGTRMAVLSLVLRFVLGPLLMALSSYVIDMRGLLLKVAIVQVSCQLLLITYMHILKYVWQYLNHIK